MERIEGLSPFAGDPCPLCGEGIPWTAVRYPVFARVDRQPVEVCGKCAAEIARFAAARATCLGPERRTYDAGAREAWAFGTLKERMR